MATVSPVSKRDKWREITRSYLREQLMSMLAAPGPLRQPRLTAWPSVAQGYTEPIAAKTPVPAAPIIIVSDDINAMLAPFQLGKTRRARMKSHFKALLLDWFLGYTSLYFPEDTRKLIASYNEYFRRGLAADKIIIQSDLPYAGIVEQLSGVQWQKSTTKDQAAAAAAADIKAAIPKMLQTSYQFALT